MQGESTLVSKGPCAACGSSDACALYSDGHTHCFSCDRTFGAVWMGAAEVKAPKDLIPFSDINIREIESRGLWNVTCQLFRYGIAGNGAGWKHVATYYDTDGKPVAQKIRMADKDFRVLGDMKSALPFGAHAWPRSGKLIVVTEGELDAMSVSQAQDNRWPVVSIANGASSVKRDMARWRDYFRNFETVVLMFDSDEPGQKAAREAAMTLALPHGQVKIATLPLKDANEMLVAGRIKELVDAIFRAVAYRPGGFLTVEDLEGEAAAGPKIGEPWCWPTLDSATFGIRPAEIMTLGAGTGIGKTSTWIQQGAHRIRAGAKVGFCLLETPLTEALLRVAGAYAGKPFFVPKEAGGWTDEDLQEALVAIRGKAFFFDPRGSIEWEAVADMLRYWCDALDIHDAVVDNLASFSANEEDDRKVLDKIMHDMSRLVQALGIRIYLVSHLKRPMGASHEEGGRVQLSQLRGSNGIGMFSNFVFGMERDQQAEDKGEQMKVTFRVLKDRNTGRATGDTIAMQYDPATARLEEATFMKSRVFSDTKHEAPSF